MLKRCLWVLPLREWVGYWQGIYRHGELIGMQAFAPEEISRTYFNALNERMQYERRFSSESSRIQVRLLTFHRVERHRYVYCRETRA